MLTPELLKKVQQIFIRSRRKVTDIFSGEYASAFRGRGIEFEEFREYVSGDDIRQIDWNVTARMDKPFVKIYREEREQTIFFLVDASRSLNFGREKTKLEVATEIAALLAYTAIRSNDKVGLIIFSDQVETYIPPQKGRGHVWRIIAELLSHTPVGKKTDVRGALQFFRRVARRRAVCFLVSDFFGEGFEEALKATAIRHEIVAIRVLDALERGAPAGALMSFEDLESGARAAFDMASFTRDMTAQAGERYQTMKRGLGARGVDFLELTSSEDYVESLLKFFIQREKKR